MLDGNETKGWGVDADPENDPTYPMKKFNGDDRLRINYQKPYRQPVTKEVLHSNERPGITAVFGTSVPPSGLSGMIRRFAFRYSEGSWGHWLPLLLADRINVIEGVVEDLKNGVVPNVFDERGLKSEWKHNKKGLIKAVAIRVAICTAVVAYISYRKSRKK